MQVSNQLISSLFGSGLANNTQGNTSSKLVADTASDFKNALKLSINSNKQTEEAEPSSNYNKSAKTTDKMNAPYSDLADDNGVINYNGVTFLCDYEHNAICLGDMSNESDIITIPLSGGGRLKVNRGNLDDLSKAIGMFSPEDVRRILEAISTDAKAKSKEVEIDNIINKTFQNI